METAEKRGTESARQQRTPVRNAGVSLWQRRHYGLRAVCIAALGGAFFGLLGPYGSYLNSGPVLRVLYWVTCAVIGVGLYAGPLFFLRHIGCMAQGVKFWSGVIGLVCVLSLLQTIMSRDLALSIWPELAHHLPGWWRWYGQVLLIAQPCVVFVIFGLRRGHRVSGKVGETAPAKIAEGASPVMLPIRIADDYPRPETILALQIDDHYIRCHQFDGSKLVHGVFREALLRQSGCTGMQVHRSWWVARKALVGWEGSSRTLRLILVNGMKVPVSRAHVAQLRAAGWLEAP